jgi:glycosyltransferase involved in cell wall biosynthesis
VEDRSRIHVKILIPVLSFSKSGGARVLSELANQWIRAGHTVTFATAVRDSDPSFPTDANVVRGSCTSTQQGVVRRIAELRRMIRRRAGEFDVILANHNLTAWAAWAAGRQARQKAVYYSQAYEAEYYSDRGSSLRRTILASLARWSYRLFPRVIVNAPIYLSYRQMRAIDWVPPGVDFSKFFPGREPWSPARNGELVIGCIGRPEPWKGTPDVFEAARILRSRGVKFRLRCAFFRPGDYGDLEDAVELSKPENDVELGQFYRSCDIFIAPGRIQLGAPHYPVMEAMACGVPIITTGYIPADSGNAWIVPVENPQAIADAVMAIGTHADEARARVAAGLSAMEDFSWDRVAHRLLTAFGCDVRLDRIH